MADNDNKNLAEIFRRNRELIAECDRKYGGPAPPLSAEELDVSETEIHYHVLRRGKPTKPVAKDE